MKLDGQVLPINMVTSSDLQLALPELSMRLRQSLKLDHILALTDDTGVIQHATFSVPARKQGYAVDDNARALVFAARLQSLWHENLAELQRKLLSFLLLMQEDDGRFHNFMDFSHRIADEASVGDHLGRAIWAAGTAMNSKLPTGTKASARIIFDRALPWARGTEWPRTKAYALLGAIERAQAEKDDQNLKANISVLADSLVESYNSSRADGWEWFENILSYDNARLCQALLLAYESVGKAQYLEVAEKTLQFLTKVTIFEGKFVPIGNRGWYVRGRDRALYDQQPIDAGTMVEAATHAYRLTHAKSYDETLRLALGWFFGLNSRSVKVYDEGSGACYDGLTDVGLNENQGAESTLSFLLAAQTVIEAFAKPY